MLALAFSFGAWHTKSSSREPRMVAEGPGMPVVEAALEAQGSACADDRNMRLTANPLGPRAHRAEAPDKNSPILDTSTSPRLWAGDVWDMHGTVQPLEKGSILDACSEATSAPWEEKNRVTKVLLI